MPLYLALTVMTPLAARMTKKNTPAGSRRDYLNKMVLFSLFATLFSVPALRGAVGNDYYWYTVIMHEVSVHGMVPTEAGFNVIVYLIYALFGFENYRFVFACMSLMTVGLFLLWLWRESEDFAFSLALFMLGGSYFQAFSTVRYYAAMPLVLLSFRYCMKRDWPRFLLMVLLASLIHKSALVVLLFYPLASLRWNKLFAVAGIVFSGVVALFPSFWMKVALRLYPSYQTAPFLGDESSPLNIVRCLLVLLLAVYVMRFEMQRDLVFSKSAKSALPAPVKMQEKERVEAVSEAYIGAYVRMTVMALAMYVCGGFLPQLSRLAFYLTIPQFILLPALVNRVGDKGKKKMVTVLILVFFVLVFLRFLMHASDDRIRVLPYTSFIFE